MSPPFIRCRSLEASRRFARDRAEVEPEELIAHCEARLPSFMVPRYVEVLDSFPKSAIGKVQKSRLREAGLTASTYDRVKSR